LADAGRNFIDVSPELRSTQFETEMKIKFVNFFRRMFGLFLPKRIYLLPFCCETTVKSATTVGKQK